MTDVNLRNVPEGLMRRVKAQAALQGLTMRQFVMDVLEEKLAEIEKSNVRRPKPRKQ
jgi:predicted DNA binding CopG/RHH family protein